MTTAPPIPAPAEQPEALGREDEDALTLIHFSDLHVWRLGLDRDFYFKLFLGLTNLVLRRGRKFPPSIALTLIERIAGENADYILFSGDLTTTSLRAEFDLGRRWLAALRSRWADRFLTIPGNHDRYTPRATRRRLYETHFDGRRPHPVWTKDLDETWTLVGFDVCVPRLVSSRGRIDPAALELLRTTLGSQRSRRRRVIVMSHYPIAYPRGIQPTWNHALPGREKLLEMLMTNKVAIYLHGHHHRRWRMNLEGLTILNAGSAGYNGSTADRRPGYLRLRLTPMGLAKVEAAYLAGKQWIDEAFWV
jgi:3',5'-cyclic AMP phosphodiesterase CpdA